MKNLSASQGKAKAPSTPAKSSPTFSVATAELEAQLQKYSNEIFQLKKNLLFEQQRSEQLNLQLSMMVQSNHQVRPTLANIFDIKSEKQKEFDETRHQHHYTHVLQQQHQQLSSQQDALLEKLTSQISYMKAAHQDEISALKSEMDTQYNMVFVFFVSLVINVLI